LGVFQRRFKKIYTIKFYLLTLLREGIPKDQHAQLFTTVWLNEAEMVAQVFKCLSKVRLAFTTWRAETVASALKKVIKMLAENKSVFYSDLQWPVATFYYFKLRKFFITKKCLLIITEA
jgi:hypothetical protein